MRLTNQCSVVVLITLLLTGGTGFAQNRRMGRNGQMGDDSGSIGQFHAGTPSDQQLWMAAFNGQMDQVRAALDQGADVNFRGKGNVTPLVAAARNGHFDVIKYLVEHGADINKRDNVREKSALLAAAFKGHYDIAEYLIEHGADINAQGVNGWTPLHDAAFVGNFRTVKLLVDHGARLDVPNNAGKTALEMAELGRVHGPRQGVSTASPEEYQQTIDYLQSHMKQ